MHRSGTSLVARLFLEAGADLGNPDTFYRADKWNSDGYFEQTDIHAINMPLINGPWWKFAYYRLPSTKTILRRANRREEQIRETAQAYRGKVVKETRFCLTLHAWQRYGAEVDRILICLRDPAQVARSIKKRNHTLLRHGYYLWHLHNARILDCAGSTTPIWLIYYNNLLEPEKFQREINAAFQFMDVPVNAEAIDKMLEDLVSTSMNHNAGFEDSYPANVQELWNKLKQKHAKQFDDQYV